MDPPVVIFSSTERVSHYDALSKSFVRVVLGLPWAMISDDSMLVDFRGCGLPSRADGAAFDDAAADAYWDTFIVERVCAQYGIEKFPVEIRMIDLFARIDSLLPPQ